MLLTSKLVEMLLNGLDLQTTNTPTTARPLSGYTEDSCPAIENHYSCSARTTPATLRALLPLQCAHTSPDGVRRGSICLELAIHQHLLITALNDHRPAASLFRRRRVIRG